MDRDIDPNIGTSIGRANTHDPKWGAWAIWSSVSLALALFVVLAGGFDPGLLLGSAVRVIIAAVLMVFRDRDTQ
jgi:hypothetical protein